MNIPTKEAALWHDGYNLAKGEMPICSEYNVIEDWTFHCENAGTVLYIHYYPANKCGYFTTALCQEHDLSENRPPATVIARYKL